MSPEQRISKAASRLAAILNLPAPDLFSTNPDPELREVETLERLAKFYERILITLDSDREAERIGYPLGEFLHLDFAK